MGILTQDNEEENNSSNNSSLPVLQQSPMSPDMRFNQDFFIQRITNGDTLEELKNALLGIEFVNSQDGIGGNYQQVYKPLINDKGLSSIMFGLNSIGLNKTKSFSRLSEDQINFKCKVYKKSLAKDLALHYEEYDIDSNNLDIIEQACVTIIHLSLQRCKDGEEAHQLSTATQKITHQVYQEQPKSQEGLIGRMWNMLPGGKK